MCVVVPAGSTVSIAVIMWTVRVRLMFDRETCSGKGADSVGGFRRGGVDMESEQWMGDALSGVSAVGTPGLL